MKQRRQMSRVMIIVGMMVLQACARVPVQDPEPVGGAKPDMIMEEVSFTTADHFTLSASWVSSRQAVHSKKAARRPVVVLLHDYGFNRRDWGIFIPDLVQQGYNVLALDLRGHGQSRKEGISTLPPPEELLQSGMYDVDAALGWIRSRKDADAKRVALIGVGVAADLAYLSAGQFHKLLQTVVVISPSYSAVNDGQFFGIDARGILFCVSSTAQQGLSMLAAQTLANFTTEPKQVIMYNGDAHGLAIFYKHPEIKQDILAWLGKF